MTYELLPDISMFRDFARKTRLVHNTVGTQAEVRMYERHCGILKALCGPFGKRVVYAIAESLNIAIRNTFSSKIR